MNTDGHRYVAPVIGACLITATTVFAGITADTALKALGSDQGMGVVAGETDGKLTAALVKGSRMYVQGCTKNEKRVLPARKVLAQVRSFPGLDATLVLLTNGGDGGVPSELFNRLWEEAMTVALGSVGGG